MIDFDNERTVMYNPFNVAIHKRTFTDYLEIIIDEIGFKSENRNKAIEAWNRRAYENR